MLKSVLHFLLSKALTVNNHTLQFLDHYWDLGILVSNNFNWTLHYHRICSNAYQSLQLICCNSFKFLYHTQIQCLSLVRSCLIFYQIHYARTTTTRFFYLNHITKLWNALLQSYDGINQKLLIQSLLQSFRIEFFSR